MKRYALLFLVLAAMRAAASEYVPKPLMFKGKPFFMLGNWDSRMGRAPRKSINPFMKGSGTNTVMLHVNMKNAAQYAEDISVIRWFAENHPDVAVIIDMNADYIFQMIAPKKFAMVSKEEQAKRLPRLEEIFRDLRACGNVIGYSIDEPENTLYGTLDTWRKDHPSKDDMDTALSHYITQATEWVREAMKKNHPEALFMPVQAWWTTYDKDPGYCDVMISNEYPVTGDQTKNPTLYSVAYDVQLSAEAAKKMNRRCFVYCPPGFNILDAGKWKNMRHYTRDELRYMWFTPISGGAMGIFGWRQFRCTNDFAMNNVFPVMNEISALFPWLLGENMDSRVNLEIKNPVTEYKVRKRSKMMGKEDDEFNIRPVKTVTWIARRNPADKSLMILACNNSGSDAEGYFILDRTLHKTYTKGLEIFEGKGIGFSGRMRFRIKPLSVAVYMLYDNNEMTR